MTTLSAEVAEAVRLRDAALRRENGFIDVNRYALLRDAAPQLVDLIERLFSEIERLTACLQKANANHEHFEREWYLRGDEIERLRAERNVILEENARLRAAVNSRTPCT